MSAASGSQGSDARWMAVGEMHALGFDQVTPEIDYGTSWGEQGQVRVSFAPHADRDGGFLYAYDRAADRYLVLAGQTTPDQVEGVWRELLDRMSMPDGYLVLSVLDHQQDAI